MGAGMMCGHREITVGKSGLSGILPASAVVGIAPVGVINVVVLDELLHVNIPLAVGSQLNIQLLNRGVSPSLHNCVSSFLEYFARGMYLAVQWRPKTAQGSMGLRRYSRWEMVMPFSVTSMI